MKGSGRSRLRAVVTRSAGNGGSNPGAGDPNDGFMGMLFANNHLQMDKDIVVDSYDSSLGSYASQAVNVKDGPHLRGVVRQHRHSNATITLEKDVHVFGDAHTGPGYTLSMDGGSYVSGSTTPAAKTVPLAAITVPALGSSGAYTVASNQTKTLNPGSYKYTGMTMNQNCKLVIKGPAAIVVGSLTNGQGLDHRGRLHQRPGDVLRHGRMAGAQGVQHGPRRPGLRVSPRCSSPRPENVQFKKESVLKIGFYAPARRSPSTRTPRSMARSWPSRATSTRRRSSTSIRT
jgi:hypothetical protein